MLFWMFGHHACSTVLSFLLIICNSSMQSSCRQNSPWSTRGSTLTTWWIVVSHFIKKWWQVLYRSWNRKVVCTASVYMLLRTYLWIQLCFSVI